MKDVLDVALTSLLAFLLTFTAGSYVKARLSAQAARALEEAPCYNAIGGDILRNPPRLTPVHHGDIICYAIHWFNTGLNNCDLLGFDSVLELPGPTSAHPTGSVVITSNATIPASTEPLPAEGQFMCPSSDPRCATPGDAVCADSYWGIGEPGGYAYIVAHDDEVGSFGIGCQLSEGIGVLPVKLLGHDAHTRMGSVVCKQNAVAHAADLDGDGDVDLADFAILQDEFSGPMGW